MSETKRQAVSQQGSRGGHNSRRISIFHTVDSRFQPLPWLRDTHCGYFLLPPLEQLPGLLLFDRNAAAPPSAVDKEDEERRFFSGCRRERLAISSEVTERRHLPPTTENIGLEEF